MSFICHCRNILVCLNENKMYYAHVYRYDEMQTTTAVYVQCKLLLNQPEVDWAMTLQVNHTDYIGLGNEITGKLHQLGAGITGKIYWFFRTDQ